MRVRRKNNNTVAIPAAASAERRSAECHRRSTVQANSFEFPIREETERSSIGRPKGKRRIVCSGDGLSCEFPQRTHTYSSGTFAVQGDERELGSIGAECTRPAVVADKIQGGAVRW